MDPLSDRERLIYTLQAYGEIPRRRDLPMCATIYDEEEEYELGDVTESE